MKLKDLTHVQVRAAIRDGAVGLLPIGATEAHGPHLPLDTDVRIAEEIARRAEGTIRETTGLQTLVLPSIAYTLTEYAAPFSGTVSVPKSVVVAYLCAVLTSAGRTGYRALCLVNGHLEPQHRYSLRDAADEARRECRCPILIADPCDRRWVSRLTEEFQRGAAHAGQYETSLLLALDAVVSAHEDLPPIGIDLMAHMNEGAKTFVEMGAEDGYFGSPADATAAEGHASFDALAAIVAEVVAEGLDSTA